MIRHVCAHARAHHRARERKGDRQTDGRTDRQTDRQRLERAHSRVVLNRYCREKKRRNKKKKKKTATVHRKACFTCKSFSSVFASTNVRVTSLEIRSEFKRKLFRDYAEKEHVVISRRPVTH